VKQTQKVRVELKRFLRAMRARIDPREAGLPVLERRRRAPGLRIEEAATLADVGLTWYSALESGKDIRASHKLLERVARALRMNADERAHLFALASPDGAVRPLRTPDDDHLRAIVDGFTIGPAFICDRFWNVSSCNALANLVYGHDRAAEKNLLARMLLEPAFAALHEDAEHIAHQMVSILHLAYGQATEDPEAIGLIERLNAESAPFTRWWNEHHVQDDAPKTTVIHHPTLGRLELLLTTFVASSLGTSRHRSMVLLQPPSDTATRERLRDAAAAAGAAT
jgi:transcriptional regulator with XRE-family HTH domain